MFRAIAKIIGWIRIPHPQANSPWARWVIWLKAFVLDKRFLIPDFRAGIVTQPVAGFSPEAHAA